MSRLLAGLIFIVIERNIDTTIRCFTKLDHLGGCKMCANGTRSIAKAGLPQHGQIEQTLYQDHSGKIPDRIPGEQPVLGAGQQPMRESGADTATVKVDDLTVRTAREDHTPAESV